MSFNKFIVTFAVLSMPLSVMADSGENSPLYIGINAAKYEAVTTSVAGVETSTKYDGYMMNLGYDINNYFAIEAMAGTSSSAKDTSPGTSSAIDYTAGLYLRLNLRFDRVVVSLLGGQTSTKISATSGSTSISSTESGTSAGFGVDFYGTRDLAVSLRSTVLYTKNNAGGGDTTLNATTLGITYYFDAPRIRSRY